MKYKYLGESNLKVSVYCLGSMTWGQGTTEEEGHWQLEHCISNGINFVDTAEMYPTNPLRRETAGETEQIIGNWLRKRKCRDDIIIATKVTGEGSKTVRDGSPISKSTIKVALEGSLKRLNSDYIDLYQLHWPNRGSYHFRQNWNFDPTKQVKSEVTENIFEILSYLSAQVKEGKIRTIGLSNESAWGTMQFINAVTENGFEKIVSIQNEYSLLCRYFDTDLAELCHNENMHLLAYSPLAAGLLTGKYQNDNVPKNSRLQFSPGLNGRINERSLNAVSRYLTIAKKFQLNPVNMALAFCAQRPFMGSVIFGSTRKEQLQTIIDGLDLELSQEILTELNMVQREHPFPI